jgi:hypothetical protein
LDFWFENKPSGNPGWKPLWKLESLGVTLMYRWNFTLAAKKAITFRSSVDPTKIGWQNIRN